MRTAGAVWWLWALLMWAGCDSDSNSDGKPVTRTVIIVDADSSLKRQASKLHVHIESDGEERFDKEYDKELWPQRYVLSPRDGDANRGFELLAEAFNSEGEKLASQRVETGFVADETRYARVVLSKCAQERTDAIEPTVLVSNETLMSAISTECEEPEPAAGSGGAGGMGGRAGGPPLKVAGSGGMAGGGDPPKPHVGGGGGGGGGGGSGGSAGSGAEDACGDGHLNASEFCDPGIMPGKQGACPSKCDSTDHCTPGKLAGTGCQARCEYTKITESIRDDMCCPAGVSASADNDCKASCGNRMIESGETCDPPDTCTAEKLCGMAPACTMAVLKGEPQSCAVTCSFQPIQVCASGDGCCPNGCSRPADMDCPVACGDGNVDGNAGETCEPSSAMQPCPKSCDDGEPCTTDVSTGSATTCNLVCWHTKIQTATNSDGCCPPNANRNNDNDCGSSCGNNVVESGELCDGNCPADAAACNDNNPCTKDSLSGSACQRRCLHAPATASTTPDGCCPAGASKESDADCGSPTNTNLLAGKVFSSSLPDSKIEPGHPVRFMTDNDDATRFISTPESPITLTADLGASYLLERIEITWAGDTIQNFTLAVSTNQQDWTTILTGMTRNLTIDAETYTSFAATPTGRYLRIVGHDRRESSYGNSIWEVRAYGK